MESSPHKEKYDITKQAVRKITSNNQSKRKLDILGIKYSVKLTVHIAYIHINHGIQTKYTTKKYIRKQSAEESKNKSGPLSSHKSEGSGKHNGQIRADASKIKSFKNRTLQKETQYN